jgi:hypothetical protein
MPLKIDAVAAPRLRTIIFDVTQGSQSLTLGLVLAAASQLRTIVFKAPVAQVHRSDIAVCGRRDVSLPRSIQSQRAAKQRSELSPRRGFASLGLTFGINLFGAAERRRIGQLFSTQPEGSRCLAPGLSSGRRSAAPDNYFRRNPRLAKPHLGLSSGRCSAAPDNCFQGTRRAGPSFRHRGVRWRC